MPSIDVFARPQRLGPDSGCPGSWEVAWRSDTRRLVRYVSARGLELLPAGLTSWCLTDPTFQQGPMSSQCSLTTMPSNKYVLTLRATSRREVNATSYLLDARRCLRVGDLT